MRKVTMNLYNKDPARYDLRSGNSSGAPLCPYGNEYQWIGYDKKEQEYVRFTKSVFKILVRKLNDRQKI